jgi:exodeoxyribonuclease VII large subunit
LQSPDGYLQQRHKSLELLQNRLITAQNQCINRNNQRYIALTAKLDAMSPLKVLSRGYAIAQTEENAVVRSVAQVQCGDQLHISFSDGTLSATVTDVKENRK